VGLNSKPSPPPAPPQCFGEGSLGP